MGESDPPVDDELSSGSSPLLARSPPQNNAKAESKKRPLCRSSRSISGSPPDIKRGQQRQTPFGTGPRVCAYPARGHSFSVSAHASPIRGNLRPTSDFFSRSSGARGYVIRTPRPTYPKLRAPPRLRYAVICYVRWLR